jgi:hypothetical protein
VFVNQLTKPNFRANTSVGYQVLQNLNELKVLSFGCKIADPARYPENAFLPPNVFDEVESIHVQLLNEHFGKIVQAQRDQISQLNVRILELENHSHNVTQIMVGQVDLETFKLAAAARLVLRRRTTENLFLFPEESTPLNILGRSLLFDADWYLENYADVKNANMRPTLHYLSSGAREGRNPGPLFNTVRYASNNPQLADLDINPLVHFETEGYLQFV